MPIEVLLLNGRPAPFKECPNCHSAPFMPFLRGQIHRRRLRWFLWGARPYVAVICWACKKTVGWEEP
jgi:hypothetical protein